LIKSVREDLYRILESEQYLMGSIIVSVYLSLVLDYIKVAGCLLFEERT